MDVLKWFRLCCCSFTLQSLNVSAEIKIIIGLGFYLKESIVNDIYTYLLLIHMTVDENLSSYVLVTLRLRTK